MNKRICFSAAAAALIGFTNIASADSASDIFLQSANSAATYDNASGDYPVITAILSKPGTVGGHNFTSTTFLAQDSTGSLDIFGLASSNPYTPAVGDAISVTGTYSPYHQIPEIGTITAITQESAGNAFSDTVASIAQLNVATLPETIAGHLIEIDNVTITGGGAYSAVLPTYSNGNVSYTMTDGTGSMVLYDWVTSYSVDAAMGGTAVPTGPVTVYGFDSVYTSGSNNTAEFVPVAIVPAPEPGSMSLLVAGAVLSVSARFRRKQS